MVDITLSSFKYGVTRHQILINKLHVELVSVFPTVAEESFFLVDLQANGVSASCTVILRPDLFSSCLTNLIPTVNKILATTTNPLISNKPKDDEGDWAQIVSNAVRDGIVLPHGYTVDSYVNCECGAEATYGKETADAAKLHSTWCPRGRL
jgi:hypothetical protein